MRSQVFRSLSFIVIVMGAALAAFAPAYADDLKVSFADKKWTGDMIPDGQQCKIFEGHGATPSLRVDHIPEGTDAIRVEFNDLTYKPLSFDGGHGVIEYAHKSGTSAVLKSVPAYTAQLPRGIRVVSAARASGDYASAGYLPPCSGGRGNTYAATIKAMSGGQILAETNIILGRY